MSRAKAILRGYSFPIALLILMLFASDSLASAADRCGFIHEKPLPGSILTGIVYGDSPSGCPKLAEFNRKLFQLDVSNMSNFPYVVRREGYTFVYFHQLKSGVHGGGSIPIVAVRKPREETWTWHLLKDLKSTAGPLNPELVKIFDSVQTLRHRPIFLRNYIVSKHQTPVLSRMNTLDKFSIFMGAIFDPLERKFFRTGYKGNRAWLFESEGEDGSTWSLRKPGPNAPKCAPIASSSQYDFSEATAARVNGNHWVASIREDSGTNATGFRERRLFQAESLDNGCTWRRPLFAGDGTQPHYLRVKRSQTDERLVLCVGDRAPFGLTPEVGILCRISRNLLKDPEQPITWGPAKMVFTIPKGMGSDLGQPGSIYIGKGMLETYFYAKRDPKGSRNGTEIFYVRYFLKDLPLPESSRKP